MMTWTGVLAMTLVVRDEEEIVATNLEYHLAQGVDVIVVIDHRSTDATWDILKEYEGTGQVHAFRDCSEPHDQARRVTRLVHIAAEHHGASWIILGDADEFWTPSVGSLRDVFAAIPDRYGYLQAERNDFLPFPPDERPFFERMVVRDKRSLSLRGTPLEPKVALRPGAGGRVLHGNHELHDPVTERAPDIGAVSVAHFPMRTFEQFERKVVRVGVANERLENRRDGQSVDQLELLRMHRNGELRVYYDGRAPNEERLERGLAIGEFVIDDRIRSVLGDGRDGSRESPWARDLLRCTWLLAGSLHDERVAARARIAELGSQLEQRRREHAEAMRQLAAVSQDRDSALAEIATQRDASARLETELEEARTHASELADLLDAIRSSRIMRHSAAARGLYYRLRP